MCAYSSTHYYDYTFSHFEYFVTPLQEQDSQSKDPIAGANADQLMLMQQLQKDLEEGLGLEIDRGKRRLIRG